MNVVASGLVQTPVFVAVPSNGASPRGLPAMPYRGWISEPEDLAAGEPVPLPRLR